ncbi:MAG: polysaccharide deacetylase family protein [Halochromatium sp.]|uniref:polysaccharide deacetylase family protein n=1 Tax=Halochromatium sp. TaxID=2049430 RepID=UPI00397A9B23
MPDPTAPSEPRIDLPIDLFGAAFFMLSRYEEAVLPDRDAHDRFPSAASLAQRAGFLERPIIDEYVEILWTAMQHLWPRLERRPHQARTLVSCDVDSPFTYAARPANARELAASGYRLARRLAADLLKRRSLPQAARTLRGTRDAWHGDDSLDPHRQGLGYIMDVNERAGRPVAFYFIPDNTHPRLDNRTSLDQPQMRALLREIHARGHENGLHPGYNTYRHPDTFARSADTLRRVLDAEGIDQPQLGGRQHFLRWETPTTARLWDANGLDYDSTLSYADRPGFRCGTCRDYPLYDLSERRPLRLRERPLIVMECSVIAERYLGLGYSEQALDLMRHYRDTCRRFQGDFSLLWHNSHLDTLDDRRFYQALITML